VPVVRPGGAHLRHSVPGMDGQDVIAIALNPLARSRRWMDSQTRWSCTASLSLARGDEHRTRCSGWEMMGSRLLTSLATVLLVASPGCSLVYTKGPQPEVQPTPECTTSNAAPVADTTLATLSVALLGIGLAGVVIATSTNVGISCAVSGCSSTAGLLAGSWAAVAVGAAMGALFATSGAVGFKRTSACRASLRPSAMLPQPKPSHLPALALEACAPVGDAPRFCSSAAVPPENGILTAP
jgi:hypothetical protein